MSARASGLVWSRSQAKGSNLLVLLSIADIADEDGRNAWPSPEHLADKTRMSPRAMRLILHKLERDGELVIDLNGDRRQVKNGYAPPFFLHVRCVFDPDGYAQRESEKIAETAFVRGRRPKRKTFPIAVIGNRKSLPRNRKSDVLKSENPGTAYKEDPSVDPLDELKAGAPPPAPPETREPENPDRNFNVIEKLAHETFDQLGHKADLGDVAEAVKAHCATLRIRYWPGDVVRRAIDSALWQRTHARGAR